MKPKFSRRDNYLRLAGFLEGEGSITVRRIQGRCNVLISVTQVLRRGKIHKYLRLFKKYFGGCFIIRKRVSKSGRRLCHYRVSNHGAVKLLNELTPFFEEKKDRAKLALKLESINLNYMTEIMKTSKRVEKRKLGAEIIRLNSII